MQNAKQAQNNNRNPNKPRNNKVSFRDAMNLQKPSKKVGKAFLKAIDTIKQRGRSKKQFTDLAKQTNNSLRRNNTSIKINSLEAALAFPFVQGWVNMPSLTHSYLCFDDISTFVIPTNATGALGFIYLPALIPFYTASPNGSPFAYWNGSAFTGVSSVPTGTLNPGTAVPSNVFIMGRDTLISSFCELTVIASEIRVSSELASLSATGDLSMALSPISIQLPVTAGFTSDAALFMAGTTSSVNPSGFDKYLYSSAVLTGTHPIAAKLNNNYSTCVTFRPHEVVSYRDLNDYDASNNLTSSIANYFGLTENFVPGVITGAGGATNIKFEIFTKYLATPKPGYLITKEAAYTSDMRSPDSVLLHINKTLPPYRDTNMNLASLRLEQSRIMSTR